MIKSKFKKHTFYLRDGDVDFISEWCEGKAVTTSEIIRGVVASFVNRARRAELPKELEEGEIEL